MALAERLGLPHADYVLPWLTAEHWRDWQLFAKPPETDDPATWSPETVNDKLAELNKRKAQWQASPN